MSYEDMRGAMEEEYEGQISGGGVAAGLDHLPDSSTIKLAKCEAMA